MPALDEVAPAASVAQPKTSRTYADRWKHPELLQSGYLVVPVDFLRHYSRLKPDSLTHGEVLLVLHLMVFKWDQAGSVPELCHVGAPNGYHTEDG